MPIYLRHAGTPLLRCKFAAHLHHGPSLLSSLPATIKAVIRFRSTMSENQGYLAKTVDLQVNQGQFSAAASLLDAAAQFLPPGSGALTSLTSGLGLLVCGQPRTVTKLCVRFTGDAANAGGQTVIFQIYKNGSPTTAVTTSIATDAGVHSASVSLVSAPLQFVDSDRIRIAVTPSAPLTAPLTDIMASIGS